MRLIMMTVFDRAVGAYLAPFFVRSVQEGRRMMVETCRDPEHSFAKHPGDYRLYQLGDFDELDARFYPLDAPELICSAEQCLPSPIEAAIARASKPDLVWSEWQQVDKEVAE